MVIATSSTNVMPHGPEYDFQHLLFMSLARTILLDENIILTKNKNIKELRI